MLWESILEFAAKHKNSEIIYYSKDNAFDEFLCKEFAENITESLIYICKNEDEVKKQLETWAKEIDEYSYQPIEDFDENKEIVDWLTSPDFLVQIIDSDLGLVEKGRLISSTSANLISIDNIECLTSNEESKEYNIETALQFEYKLKDGGTTSEIINTGIRVAEYDEDVYLIKDVYRMDEYESEI